MNLKEMTKQTNYQPEGRTELQLIDYQLDYLEMLSISDTDFDSIEAEITAARDHYHTHGDRFMQLLTGIQLYCTDPSDMPVEAFIYEYGLNKTFGGETCS